MNDLAFAKDLTDMLSSEGIDVWLFGGWAEELLGLAEPRAHHDVDLLFPAEGFERVDELIRRRGLVEVAEKHFAHKRAIVVDEVLVEMFLVQRDDAGYFTMFFGERRDWTSDVVADTSGPLATASSSSLRSFRSGWELRPHLKEHSQH